MPTLKRVRTLIREAFPRSLEIQHPDCVGLRTHLTLFEDDGLFTVLGPVLLDLAESQTLTPAELEGGDFVVRFLCSAAPPPVGESAATMPHLAPFFSEHEEFVRRNAPEQDRRFRQFTSAQARAIYEWLRLAETWDTWRIDDAELAAAITYWKLRMEELAGRRE